MYLSYLIILPSLASIKVKRAAGPGEFPENLGNDKFTFARVVLINYLRLICYNMLPGRKQICPDFEVRWCCPTQNYTMAETELDYSINYANYSISDLPTSSKLR